MSCGSCGGGGPSKYSPEFTRRQKPESNQGCCPCHGASSCDTPSLASDGSPLAKWEAIYGKLITTVKTVQDEWGHTVQIVEKKTCPLPPERVRKICCSLRYKVRN